MRCRAPGELCLARLGRPSPTPCRDTGPGRLHRDWDFPVVTEVLEKSVATELFCRACPHALSQHQPPKPYRDLNSLSRREAEEPLSCGLVPAIAPPCHDKENPVATQGLRNPVAIDFLCRDGGLTMGNSPFWPPAPPVPIFLSFQGTLNSHKLVFLLQRQ